MDEEVQGDAPVAPNLDKMAEVYIKIRDAKDLLTNKYKAEYAELDAQMDVVEAEMLDICRVMNANGFKTPHGTVIRSVKSKYWTSDWDSMYQFINEHDAPFLLEQRIHGSNMREFLENNPDAFPVGMQAERKYTVQVRKPTKK
jgi:hypothetical protein